MTLLWEELAAGLGTHALGQRWGYVIVTGPAGVRLTRWRHGHSANAAAEAAANLIFLPLGRGPGRPGGDPELRALAEQARQYAEEFERGQDLSYPGWQHEQAVAL